MRDFVFLHRCSMRIARKLGKCPNIDQKGTWEECKAKQSKNIDNTCRNEWVWIKKKKNS